MRLSTAIRHFEEQLRADGKSAITREVYVRDLELLQKWLGKTVTIESVTPLKLRRFINSKAFSRTSTGNLKAPVSLNRSKSAIRTFFQFAVDTDYVKRNPARLVRLARTSPKPPRPMSDADVKKLFAALRKGRSPLARRDELMTALMLGTGIRLGSLVGLSVEDVDLAAGTIRIQTKGGAEQLVYLNPELRRQLRRHMKELDDASVPLFRTQSGRRLQARQVQIRFAMWLGKSSVKNVYTVHSLRHTFATRLYQHTKDIRLVQSALGHSHVTTTEIYAQATTDRVRDAVLG